MDLGTIIGLGIFVFLYLIFKVIDHDPEKDKFIAEQKKRNSDYVDFLDKFAKKYGLEGLNEENEEKK